MKGPRHPDALWFRIAFVAAALLSIAWGAFYFFAQTRSRSFASLPEAMREELAQVPVLPRATAEVEREWVRDGFGGEQWLVAPVGPVPCAAPGDELATDALALQQTGEPATRIDALSALSDTDPANLIVALLLGTNLIEAGRYAEADRVLSQALDRTRDDEQIIAAARDPRTRLDLSDQNVSTVIHVHHALGVARLAQSSTQPPWKSLKNVIGSVKPLSQRRLLGSSRGEPSWSKLLIAAPGCATAGPGALSSYDLYNNLIAGYMRGGRFEGDAAMRAREFARPAKTYPSAVHELLLAQIKRAEANGWQNEAQLWALSNVEQLLDWRRPDDARLNLNAIQIIDCWLAGDRCPNDVCTTELRARLTTQKDELLEQALLRRNVAPDQQRAFAQATTRLLAMSTLPRSRVADAANAMREWLPPSQAAVINDLVDADAARAELPRWITRTAAEDAQPPEKRIGRNAQAWRSAADLDFAAAAATWAATRSPGEQRDVLIATRQLLGAAKPPRAVVDLESRRDDRLSIRLAASKAWFALVAVFLAAITMLVLFWMLVVIRDARTLRTSFYNVELEHLRASDPPPRNE
jgi:tetratricopeptide (TPR) repeat protein